MTAERMFKMQGGPSIPWSVAEEIYKIYSALYGTGQSLERLNERGGFGWSEVEALAKRYFLQYGRLPAGWSR